MVPSDPVKKHPEDETLQPVAFPAIVLHYRYSTRPQFLDVYIHSNFELDWPVPGRSIRLPSPSCWEGGASTRDLKASINLTIEDLESDLGAVGANLGHVHCVAHQWQAVDLARHLGPQVVSDLPKLQLVSVPFVPSDPSFD